MKIIFAHNYYKQSGGEDTVFSSEVNLLRGHGHTIIEYADHNDRIDDLNAFSVAAQTIWSKKTYRNFFSLLDKEKPDIVHFHNIFPLISPSAYYACQDKDVPVVQSLHNPRIICVSSNFYRQGKLCTDCLQHNSPWPGVIHACYHNSRVHSATVALMSTVHRVLRTWQMQVDAYIVFTKFYRQIFTQIGLPKEKLFVKPHFVISQREINRIKTIGNYALFIGRLDPEKGVLTMLAAWENLDFPLIIRGDGQLKHKVQDFIAFHKLKNVKLLERVSKAKLTQLIRNSRFLVWPSEGFYENFGMVAIECYAQGIPVLASNTGVMSEVVVNKKTGLLFAPGESRDLSAKAQWLWNHIEESNRMGKNARHEYEEKYSPEQNYRMLIDIYQKAIMMKHSG